MDIMKTFALTIMSYKVNLQFHEETVNEADYKHGI